jgi:hypothetical protein
MDVQDAAYIWTIDIRIKLPTAQHEATQVPEPVS